MAARHLNLCDESEKGIDFVEHIDHWLEYLTELMDTADKETLPKLKRQIRYLLAFRCGTNCNINHNFLLQNYYSNPAKKGGDDISLFGERNGAEENRPMDKIAPDTEGKIKAFLDEFKAREGTTSMSIHPTKPIQERFKLTDPAFKVILKALSSEDLFFMQGPPGTGKTTAIVEIVLQVMKAKPRARILISSETHVAVDNALDRLAQEASPALLSTILRYPQFFITEFECANTPQAEAIARADALWHKAYEAAPGLTMQLWNTLELGKPKEDGNPTIARWQARSLAEMHQVIGVTCNQIDHLIDEETGMFDLAIVDECSKATMPEWLMAMSVAKKCILVGDHKQLPPTFCAEESEVLEQMDEHKESLIRNGVIERLFENLPPAMKGTLGKQFRMLPYIGQFISHHFYKGELEHHRMESDHEFQDFGWFTYKSNDYRVPAQMGKEKKVLVNDFEIRIIVTRLSEINDRLKRSNAKRKISVALITPYRAQCKALRQALKQHDFSEVLAVEVDTVDAFQGREADIVFFSFVRNTGPATFYADDRRMNVAISRARDAVYLVGDIEYIAKKQLPILDALAALPILTVD
jgi:ATP-dependent RNA/DNA helicase IGHMBP2